MSKTLFQNGTVVTSNYLNTIYNTNDGHKHDGGDEDGSAAKVHVADHTKGELPIYSRTSGFLPIESRTSGFLPIDLRTSGVLPLSRVGNVKTGSFEAVIPSSVTSSIDIPFTMEYVKIGTIVQLSFPWRYFAAGHINGTYFYANLPDPLPDDIMPIADTFLVPNFSIVIDQDVSLSTLSIFADRGGVEFDKPNKLLRFYKFSYNYGYLVSYFSSVAGFVKLGFQSQTIVYNTITT